MALYLQIVMCGIVSVDKKGQLFRNYEIMSCKPETTWQCNFARSVDVYCRYSSELAWHLFAYIKGYARL